MYYIEIYSNTAIYFKYLYFPTIGDAFQTSKGKSLTRVIKYFKNLEIIIIFFREFKFDFDRVN